MQEDAEGWRDEFDISCDGSQLNYRGTTLTQRTYRQERADENFIWRELELETSEEAIPCTPLIGEYRGRECSLRKELQFPRERN
jgi:hypothetical protein